MNAICEPEDAAYPPEDAGLKAEVFDEHRVTLDAKLLRELTRPVHIPKPGLDWTIVAKMLGISTTTLKWSMRAGVFRVTKVPGLGGKWGRPVPELYTDKPLDPCSGRLREHADPVWGTTWKYLCDRVPDELEQTLTRVPRFVDSRAGTHFMGWLWRCPGCARLVRVVYYPLPPVHGVRLLDGEWPELGGRGRDPNDADARPEPLRAFACMLCHNVMYFSRLDGVTWNKLISHLSNGLMYGRDVPRPAWYRPERKRAFHPILRREPSRRRQLILDDILAGLSYTQIMRKQQICLSTVSMQAAKIYAQHRVKGPVALRALMARRSENSKLKNQVTSKAQSSNRSIQPRAAA